MFAHYLYNEQMFLRILPLVLIGAYANIRDESLVNVYIDGSEVAYIVQHKLFIRALYH